jgi:hypothetical protein
VSSTDQPKFLGSSASSAGNVIQNTSAYSTGSFTEEGPIGQPASEAS